jgi:hypothetical protein
MAMLITTCQVLAKLVKDWCCCCCCCCCWAGPHLQAGHRCIPGGASGGAVQAHSMLLLLLLLFPRSLPTSWVQLDTY